MTSVVLAVRQDELEREVQLDRLREISIENVEKLLLHSYLYVEQSKKCAKLFNTLMSSLDNNQRNLLFSYEEAISLKEEVITEIVSVAF